MYMIAFRGRFSCLTFIPCLVIAQESGRIKAYVDAMEIATHYSKELSKDFEGARLGSSTAAVTTECILRH